MSSSLESYENDSASEFKDIFILILLHRLIFIIKVKVYYR